MFRKTLLIAAAIAMPLGIVAATGGIASAKAAPPTDVTHYTLTCTGINAKASFNPPLTLDGGTASNEATTIKGTASGCTASGSPTVTISKVSISGTINSADSTHACTALGTGEPIAESGTLKASYKTSPKSTPTSSELSVSSVTGDTGANGHAQFSIAFSGGTGAFQGTNGGATTSTNAQTTDPFSTLATTCTGKKGLKSLAVEANGNGGGPTLFIG